ncbi:type 1 glutamine amidotransferase domain-containing protein [Salinisphaera hydrothermalis]|uniref:PfpI family intracellular protease n=1 Tax=Salinisphaera hydrothermalis (strain C41B8) TaxID=1304275 RepID=A0A084IRJ7_SALHC|nr:type 1 glutamine amidotransferase domain-containing protein [Salinisphaera hydrothermalis]KEZ79331.1 PfpI family intracellular protease [Salinisphaera hydrothermalis C41B8]
MAGQLNGKKIAFLAADGFEQIELTRPRKDITDAGAEVHLISLESGEIQGMNGDINKADTFKVDKTIDEVSASDYHGLVLPGGVVNPDNLRTNDKAVAFVRDFFAQHKPVAAICHAPIVLIEARVLDGRTVTSFPSIKTDLQNAGATWVDQEVVCDEALVTSRTPDDLDAFCAKAIEEFAEGRHEDQTV